MSGAFGWGTLGLRSLAMSVLIASLHAIGLIMGFGGGVLINAVAFVLTFAAGAILTMLADTMMPEAFGHGGKLFGVVTTLGFAIAFTIHLLD